MAADDPRELLAEVASLYYEEDLTQAEIGDRLGLSRVKVYRLLKQAREEQVVQIVINWPMKRDAGLEAALCTAFGLGDALVLHGTATDAAAGLHQLGQLVARYLEQFLQNEMTMAVCLGRSTYEVINAIRPGFRAKVRVAQAMGSTPFAMHELDSPALARRLAHKLGGEVLYLASPLMANSAADAAVLRSQRDIERTLAAARQADIALLGIGNLDAEQSGFVRGGFMTPEEVATLVASGAVGDIAGYIFTQDGTRHPTAFNERIIGISFEDLLRVPRTIAVAAGVEKARAILGALRTGIVKTLCTDDRTAAAVLALRSEYDS